MQKVDSSGMERGDILFGTWLSHAERLTILASRNRVFTKLHTTPFARSNVQRSSRTLPLCIDTPLAVSNSICSNFQPSTDAANHAAAITSGGSTKDGNEGETRL